MKEIELWEPVLDSKPSDKFVCIYGGPFAQQLRLNRPVIEQFLSIASLEGRVLVTESRYKKSQATPDINPDGSVAGRGSLRWGEKPVLEQPQFNPYFQVKPDALGWLISINGELITEDLTKKHDGVVRGLEDQVAKRVNLFLRAGLKESLLRDKFTFAKDPWLN